MDEILVSECSSGCESGWTLYLDHSFVSPYPSSHKGNELVNSEGKKTPTKDEDEEEDSSMVSDASSGPPIFHEDDQYYGNGDNGCFYHAPIDVKSRGKRKKTTENRHRKVEDHHPSFLDDTASSPNLNFSQQLNNNKFTLPNHQASMDNLLDFSEGCSSTDCEGRSALHGFFQSSPSKNQLQQNQWFGGKMGGDEELR